MVDSYLPVSLRLAGRKCLIVGGGAIAYRKAKALVAKGAEITIIAPENNAGLQQMADAEMVRIVHRPYQSPEAADYGLVISATDDEAVNQTVYEDCTKARVPVNVVDDPARCDFIFPAVVNRGSLSLAISTDGRAPFLTAFIRRMLETGFGPQWELVTNLAEAYRAEVRRRFPDDLKRQQQCYRKFLDIDWSANFRSTEPTAVEDTYSQLLESL